MKTIPRQLEDILIGDEETHEFRRNIVPERVSHVHILLIAKNFACKRKTKLKREKTYSFQNWEPHSAICILAENLDSKGILATACRDTCTQWAALCRSWRPWKWETLHIYRISACLCHDIDARSGHESTISHHSMRTHDDLEVRTKSSGKWCLETLLTRDMMAKMEASEMIVHSMPSFANRPAISRPE